MNICAQTVNNVFDASMNSSRSPLERVHVVILMCSYNGERFLAEQMDSFQRQTHSNWSLIISDDGSQDGTLALLQAYVESGGPNRMRVVQGAQQGFVKNFLSLTCRTDMEAEFFAWADQDDIWSDDKLATALTWLQTVNTLTPALYCGRTQLISETGAPLGFSPRFELPPSFANALIQNIGGGNTMVFNKAARGLLQEAGDNLVIPSHDWWAYQLISGTGGAVHYDPEPKVLYRQHGANLVGSNVSWAARVKRLRMVFQGRFYEWNTQNIRALDSMRHRLSEEHKVTFDRFREARNQTLVKRCLGIRRAGLYRQTWCGNLGLIVAALFKKI